LAINIFMSQFGPEMKEGKIIRWLKSEGDVVIKGESLLEVESEKAVVEIETPADGILGPILKGEESVAKVGELLGQIFMQDEIARQVTTTPAPTASSSGETETETGHDDRQTRSDGKMKISPLAKRLAQDLGIDISLVRGSGPKGRVTEADVRRATRLPLEQTKPASEASNPAQKASVTPQDMQPLTSEEVKTVTPTSKPAKMALERLRATIANRMHESHQVTAPVTLTIEVCATSFVELRKQLLAELSEELDFSVGYNELMIKVAACALHTFRYMNARLEAGTFQLLDDINIGLAVDTPQGLVVPVIRDAYRKGVAEVGHELSELIEKIRSGTPSPEDLSGGTFTITNLGKFEIDAFTPIINLPQAAILGVGGIKQRPYVVDGQLVVRDIVWLSLTFDHRLVDGAPAALFLQYIKRLIEKPGLLLL
jgi:pyruvate dehydrogenase E2 component (dihydrolipoamide acetyltransferase)